MSINALSLPRFGARISLSSTNQSRTARNSDTYRELQAASAAMNPRICTVDDKIDPIEVGVHVNDEDSYQATLKTKNNGTIVLERQIHQTPATFMEGVTSAVEAFAKTLINPIETQKQLVRAADEFLLPVLKAAVSGQIKVNEAYSDGTHSQAYIEANGQSYVLSDMGKSLNDRTQFSISTKHKVNEPNTKFTISYTPEAGFSESSLETEQPIVTDQNILKRFKTLISNTHNGQKIDYNDGLMDESLADSLNRRAWTLFQVLERQNVFVGLNPLYK